MNMELYLFQQQINIHRSNISRFVPFQVHRHTTNLAVTFHIPRHRHRNSPRVKLNSAIQFQKFHRKNNTVPPCIFPYLPNLQNIAPMNHHFVIFKQKSPTPTSKKRTPVFLSGSHKKKPQDYSRGSRQLT
jgi:hypothetical protein